MGKKSYLGGSTVVGPGSDWFSYKEPKPPKASWKMRSPEERLRDQRRGDALLKEIASNPCSQPEAGKIKNARIEAALKRMSFAEHLERVRHDQEAANVRNFGVTVEVRSKKILLKRGSKI